MTEAVYFVRILKHSIAMGTTFSSQVDIIKLVFRKIKQCKSLPPTFPRFAKAERTVVKRLVPFFEFGGYYSLVFRRFCPIAGLQRSTVKSKIVGTASFLSTSRRGLKEGPHKLLTVRFCSKLSSMKCSAQTRECFEGVKHSVFIFISYSLLRFGSWGNIKVLTFDFELFVQFMATQNTIVFRSSL